MGVFWVGLMSPVPAMALYTLLGVFTTWYLRILAYRASPSSPDSLALISPGKSLSSSLIVASMMSSSLLPIQSLAGANTSSSMLLSSAYPLQVVLMSAYTDSRGDLENSRWSTVDSFLSNQMWMLITGMPSRGSKPLKYCMLFHWSGSSSFRMSTGAVEMYASASTSVPSTNASLSTVFPSSISSKDLILVFILTSP